MGSPSAVASPDEATLLRAAPAAAVALAALPFLLLLPMDYDRLAPVALLPALWLSRKIGTSDRAGSRLKIDGWLLLLTITFTLVSAVSGPHPFPSITSWSSWIWVFAGAILARQATLIPGAIRWILAGITSGATLGCLAVWLRWREGISIHEFPVYGHGRIFGLHMMMGTMTGLVLLTRSAPSRLERLLAAVGTAIACGGLMWAGGRSGIAGVMAGGVVWLWRSPTVTRRKLIQYSAIVVVAGFAISLLHWSPENYLGWWTAAARTTAATTVNELSSTRLDFWKATWDAFLEHPWLGRGANSYRYLTPKLDGDQPHNWMLQFLLDFGVLGGVTLGVLLVRQAVRGFSRYEASTESDNLRQGAAAGLVACLTTGLLDGVFYHAVVLIPAAFLAGIAGSSQLSPVSLASQGRFSTPPFNLNSQLGLTSSRFLLFLSVAVLVLHSYLTLHLRYLPPPPSPDALPARILRVFPSSTLGIDAWLAHWRSQNETVALDWTLWAQKQSEAPARLYVLAAVIYADRDDFVAADREMELAEKTVHWTGRENVRHMRHSIRRAGLESAISTRDR